MGRTSKAEVRERDQTGAGKELNITNAMAIPKLEKIVINMGLGEATQNVKIMDH